QVGDDPTVGYVRIGVCTQKGVGGDGVLATGGQHHGGQVQVHVGQYLAQVVCGQSGPAHRYPQGVGTVHQVGVQTLLERFRFGVGVAGPDVPPVGESTCGSVAPGEGRQTGKTRVGRGRIEGVQGRDVEPVVGAGGQNRFGRVGEAFLGDTALA